MLSAGYNSINLPTQLNYFRGGMFVIDQTIGGRIALEKPNDPTCLSDFVTDDNYTLIQNMDLIYPTTSSCQRFYFRAYGKKYATNETISFTRNYSHSAIFPIEASFTNFHGVLATSTKNVYVYGTWTEWGSWTDCAASKTIHIDPMLTQFTFTLPNLDCNLFCKNYT